MRLARPGKAALLLAVGAAGGGAAMAVASVGGSDTINACVSLQPGSSLPVATGANLRVIDPGSPACNTNAAVGTLEQPLSWNVVGPPGTNGTNGTNGSNGAPGAPGTVTAGSRVTLPGGTTLTIVGSPPLSIPPPPSGNTPSPLHEFTLDTSHGNLSFDIVGYSLTPTNSGGAGHSTGAGSGKATLHEFTIIKTTDKATPLLAKAVYGGAHYKTATLALRKAGNNQPYLLYTFTTVYVVAVQWSSSGDTPKESITFEYGGLTVKYNSQGSGGKKRK